MFRFMPLALLAISPLAHAQVNDLHDRGYDQACCPCPGYEAPESTKTITVTATATAGPVRTVTITQTRDPDQTKTVYVSQGVQVYPPRETITVERTVTQSANTVYVTRTGQYTVTKEVTVDPAAPSGSEGEKPVYETITYAGNYPRPDGNVITKTLVYGDKPGAVRTVTIGAQGGKKTVTLKESDEQVSTKTIKNEDGQDHYYTVVIRPQPITKTITLVNGVVTTKVIDVGRYVTVTAAPDPEGYTVTRRVQTVTRTVTVDGKTEEEIIVVDHETGKTTCKYKDSGRPCYPDNDDNDTDYDDSPYPRPPIPSGCGTVDVSTSIKTVYNTVVVTVSPGSQSSMTTSTTTPTPEDPVTTESEYPGRRARAPEFFNWW